MTVLETDKGQMVKTPAATLASGLLIPNYLIHSCLYYVFDYSVIEDYDYDMLARRIYAEWDSLEHVHKHLIDKEGLLSGGSYIRYTTMIENAAQSIYRNHMSQTDQPAKKKINARSKGQRGEREIIDLLQPHINEVSAFNNVDSPFLQRNQLQTHAGGYDIVGLDGYAFEVKRVETDQTGQINGWWAQCVGQAKAGEVPVLFYRRNGGKWKVRMFVRLDLDEKQRYKIPGDIKIEAFIFYMK